MVKQVKKFIAICMFIIILFGTESIAYADSILSQSETNTEGKIYEVGLLDAEKVAVNHVLQVINGNKDSFWSNGVRINERRAIFDEKNNIVEYYFGLCDINNNPRGYIITGASTSMYPIIEYSDEGESFINQAIEVIVNIAENNNDTVENSKIYYGGDLFYAVENEMQYGKNIVFDISSANFKEIEKNDIPTDVIMLNNYDYLWKVALESSYNPPDSGNSFITSPNNYESGYTSSRYYIIDNGHRYYNVMTDFSSGGVCAPTAATNLCKYWYLRDPSKYSPLFENLSWSDTFWHIFDCMGTSTITGTSDYKVADGYRLFFYERGLSCNAYLCYGTNNGLDIVDELNNNRPCHLIVHDHYMYGDHSVVAVGYSQFTYSNWYGDSYSTYIRIADGWTNYPSRYVWGGCNGSWNYVVVIPD